MNASEEPLLSFCVPTYQRPEALERLLSSLAAQVSRLGDPQQIEIIVADNCPEESGREAFDAYVPWGRYFCHGQNLGADRNMDFCINAARGKFLWLFGDDDNLAEGAISIVLRRLGEMPDDAGLIYIGRVVLDGEGRVLKEAALELTEAHELGAADSFLLLGAELLTASSSILRTAFARREYWRDYAENFFISPALYSLRCIAQGSAHVFPGQLVLYTEANKERWAPVWWPAIRDVFLGLLFYRFSRDRLGFSRHRALGFLFPEGYQNLFACGGISSSLKAVPHLSTKDQVLVLERLFWDPRFYSELFRKLVKTLQDVVSRTLDLVYRKVRGSARWKRLGPRS